MCKSDNKVGLIEQYKQELKSIQNHSFTNSNNIGYWNRLTDYISKFSTDQLKFIDNNQQVIKAHNDMLNTFVQYLFEKNKDDFAAFDEFLIVFPPIQQTAVFHFLLAWQEMVFQDIFPEKVIIE